MGGPISGAGGGAVLSTATPQPPGVADPGATREASDAGHVHDRELPDPRDAHDGQVPTTTGGAYVLAGAVTLSTATPQPPGTAAAGSTGEASDAGHVHDRELPDPTGAHDGQVPTTASGAYVLATPAGGGPTIGSGTYAARPASPTVGDSYTVTSGARRGSVYRCDVAGLWSLVTVAVPQLGAAVGLFDGERLERLGGSLRRWNNLAPRGRGYDLSGGAPIRGVAAMGPAGLLAHGTTPGGSTMRGVLPIVVAGAPRTVAALVRPTGPFGGAGGNPGTAVVLDWGSADLYSALGICVRVGFTDVWGLHYGWVYEASATSSVEAAPVVVVATYDGADARLYREGTLIDTHTVALSGAGADGFFTAMSANAGGETSWGTIGFAGAWDVALSAGEVTTLTSLLRERYGL